jgi:hypothetical protein
MIEVTPRHHRSFNSLIKAIDEWLNSNQFQEEIQDNWGGDYYGKMVGDATMTFDFKDCVLCLTVEQTSYYDRMTELYEPDSLELNDSTAYYEDSTEEGLIDTDQMEEIKEMINNYKL